MDISKKHNDYLTPLYLPEKKKKITKQQKRSHHQHPRSLALLSRRRLAAESSAGGVSVRIRVVSRRRRILESKTRADSMQQSERTSKIASLYASSRMMGSLHGRRRIHFLRRRFLTSPLFFLSTLFGGTDDTIVPIRGAEFGNWDNLGKNFSEAKKKVWVRTIE